MGTGLFPIRKGSGGRRRGCTPAQRAVSRSQIDAFAEALAGGTGSVAAASALTGVTLARGRTLFARIKAELGWQAR